MLTEQERLEVIQTLAEKQQIQDALQQNNAALQRNNAAMRGYTISQAFGKMGRAFERKGMAIAYRSRGDTRAAERLEREAADLKAEALEDAAALGVELSI
jgi:hypothetical protein